jgi:hypothetical protein
MPVRTSTRTDTGTLAIIGVICAIAGCFVLGIVLGPVAVICGWLAMGRTWGGSKSIPAVVALGPVRRIMAGATTLPQLDAGWGSSPSLAAGRCPTGRGECPHVRHLAALPKRPDSSAIRTLSPSALRCTAPRGPPGRRLREPRPIRP